MSAFLKHFFFLLSINLLFIIFFFPQVSLCFKLKAKLLPFLSPNKPPRPVILSLSLLLLQLELILWKMREQNYVSNAPGPVQHHWFIPIPTKNTWSDTSCDPTAFFSTAAPRWQWISPTMGIRFWLLTNLCFYLQLRDPMFAQLVTILCYQPVPRYHPALVQPPEPPLYLLEPSALPVCSAYFLATILNSGNNNKNQNLSDYFPCHQSQVTWHCHLVFPHYLLHELYLAHTLADGGNGITFPQTSKISCKRR